jgi:hypothetical protein
MTEDKRFYGIYMGVCKDNEDPDNLNRVRLQVPQILGEEITEWARSCTPVTDNANHPDHKAHLASEVAALLVNHSLSVTSGSGGSPSHTHSVTATITHAGNTTQLDHPHEATSDTLDMDGSEAGGTAAEHTYHRAVPNLDQKVWVMFEGGDPNFPVWMGVELV